jgi:hypothetical protein
MKADQSGWLTAAAIFWFEAWGLIGLVYIGVLPLMMFMHGTWPPSTWVDGSVLRLAILLATVGVIAAVMWLFTTDRSRLRASFFSGLGLVGLATTVAIALTATAFMLVVVAFWLIWPSLVLLIVWGRRATRNSTSAG